MDKICNLLEPYTNQARLECDGLNRILQWLTPQAVLFLLQKRAKETGVASFSPHDFRRTFASDLLDAGVDIVTVQKLMGHSSPDTTSRYCRRSEKTKHRAVQVLQIPGAGRRKE